MECLDSGDGENSPVYLLGRVDGGLWPGRAMRPGFLAAGGEWEISLLGVEDVEGFCVVVVVVVGGALGVGLAWSPDVEERALAVLAAALPLPCRFHPLYLVILPLTGNC